MLTGLIFALVIILFIIFLLVMASSRLLLLLLGLAAAASSATMFLAGRTCTLPSLLLVSLLIFCFLLLDKLFDLSAFLDIMALGVVDLAVLLAEPPVWSAADKA
jgi:hypothetical protein